MPRPFLDRRNIPRNAVTPPQISFRLFGQWPEVMNQLKRIGPEVKKQSVKAQLKVCNVICTKVKRHLRDQDLGWVELDDVYAAKKQRAGLSGKTLMAYKTYYDNIKVWKSGNRHLLNIGVKKGIYTREIGGKKSRVDVATIAGIHEFSSGKKLPRRPLWNPTIAEIGGAKGIKKMYVNSLVWHLRAAGIKVHQKRGVTSSITVEGSKLKF